MSPKQLTIVTLPAGTSTLHEQLFCFGQDNPLKLPYSHIACEGTLPLHELPFCVGQDPSLKVAFGHIACKSTSPLNFYFLKFIFQPSTYNMISGFILDCRSILGFFLICFWVACSFSLTQCWLRFPFF